MSRRAVGGWVVGGFGVEMRILLGRSSDNEYRFEWCRSDADKAFEYDGSNDDG